MSTENTKDELRAVDAAVAGYVVCHVCHGRKKSPYGHWDCSCCKGRGTLTEQEYRIKTTIMLDLARRLRDPHTDTAHSQKGRERGPDNTHD